MRTELVSVSFVVFGGWWGVAMATADRTIGRHGNDSKKKKTKKREREKTKKKENR